MPITIHNVYDEERTDRDWCKPFTFPGGEPHVQLNPDDFAAAYVWVDARIGTAEEFMHLLAVMDALSRIQVNQLGLFLPYYPGARQDRASAPGAPFTLDIYRQIVGHMMWWNYFLAVDIHSDVLTCEYIRQHAIDFIGMNEVKYDGVIRPDAGAEKRSIAFADKLGVPLFRAEKKRDPTTGKLSGFACEPIPNGRYLIVDDICDGGGTFIGLAQQIRMNNPGAILDLCVTHGIFSKGFGELCQQFRRIYTTDSFPRVPKVAGTNGVFVTELHPYAARLMRERIAK